MRFLRTAILTVLMFVGANLIFPTTAHANPAGPDAKDFIKAHDDVIFIEDGELKIQEIQNYLYLAKPESDDGFLAYYPLKDDLYIEVSKLGDMTVKSHLLEGLEYEYGNVHLPQDKQDCACIQTTSGTISIENDKIVRYWYGSPISEKKLEVPILGTVEGILRYPQENIYIVLAGGNVFSIDKDGGVNTLYNQGDVKSIALTNFLDIPDVQISIITQSGDWYYTIEPFFGEWRFVDKDIEGFQCDRVIKK